MSSVFRLSYHTNYQLSGEEISRRIGPVLYALHMYFWLNVRSCVHTCGSCRFQFLEAHDNKHRNSKIEIPRQKHDLVPVDVEAIII